MFTKGLTSMMAKGILGIIAVGALTFSGVTWNGQDGLDGVRATVENLVNTIYELNNDKNLLLGHIDQLNSQYASLTQRYNELTALRDQMESENSQLVDQLNETIALLEADIESVRIELTLAQAQLEEANAEIVRGQEEISRLEGELLTANNSVEELTREVEALLRRIEGITPGVTLPELGGPQTPDNEMTVYEQARAALLAANIPGITDNVTVYIGSETSFNIRFRVVDTSGPTLWTDDWSNIQQVIDIVRDTYGGSHAWAAYYGGGEGSIYVQR